MTRRSGKLDIARRTATALAALLVSGLLAAPALAHGERYEGHGRSAYGHVRGDVHRHRPARIHRGIRTHVHGEACGFRGARGHRARHAVHRAAAFRCGPCGHAFHDRSAFYRHLHARHRVPLGVIPGAVVHVGFGWVFPG